MSKVKITDIAERSGVSMTTVSRYFNHPELISQTTQDKIKTAIKELNYQQDNLARILVTGESNLVGVIFPPPTFKLLYRITQSTNKIRQRKRL